MKILLTSFGIADAINREPSKEESIFYRMPPVSVVDAVVANKGFSNIQPAMTLGLVCVVEFDVAAVGCMNELQRAENWSRTAPIFKLFFGICSAVK